MNNLALKNVFLKLRAIRTGSGFVAGSCLAVAGVLVQGLVRNPLASPSILGTTAGANLGARLAILTVASLPPQFISSPSVGAAFARGALLPVGCLTGALMALGIVLFLTRSRSDQLVLVLTGFLLSSLFASLGGLVASALQDKWELSRAVLSFSLGDISATGSSQLAIACPLAVIGCLMAWVWSTPLDRLLTGQDEALSLGLDIAKTQRWLVVWIAVLTAAAVTVGGNIGFVGLVVPHALRPLVGERHHRLVIATFLAGGSFVTLCDLLCRAIPGQSEIPLGVVTGLIGAPSFLWILERNRRKLRAG